MNVKCEECKGRGILNRDGKMTKAGKPYDVVCPQCNGVGHYRIRAVPRRLAHERIFRSAPTSH